MAAHVVDGWTSKVQGRVRGSGEAERVATSADVQMSWRWRTRPPLPRWFEEKVRPQLHNISSHSNNPHIDNFLGYEENGLGLWELEPGLPPSRSTSSLHCCRPFLNSITNLGVYSLYSYRSTLAVWQQLCGWRIVPRSRPGGPDSPSRLNISKLTIRAGISSLQQPLYLALLVPCYLLFLLFPLHAPVASRYLGLGCVQLGVLPVRLSHNRVPRHTERRGTDLPRPLLRRFLPTLPDSPRR